MQSGLQRALGVGFSCLGTCCGGLGDNLVRRAYTLEANGSKAKGVEVSEVRPLWGSGLWLLGWCLTLVVDTVCNIVALELAPLELIAPLGALHILWGAIFASFINGECLRRSDALGGICVLLGIGIVLLLTPGGGKTNAVSLVTNVTGLPCQGTLSGLAFLMLLSIAAHRSGFDAMSSVARPTIAGLCGVMSNSLLFLTEHSGGSAIFFALLTGAAASMQLLTLNWSLATGEACIVVPVTQTVLLLGASIVGSACFDVKQLAVQDILLLGTGMLLCCSGICIIASRPLQTPAMPHDDSESAQPQSYGTVENPSFRQTDNMSARPVTESETP